MLRGLTLSLLPCALLMLAGCDGVGKSPEQRINAAVPVAAEVSAARSGLAELAKNLAQDDGPIEQEFQARMKVRALECAHGYTPAMSASDETIRAALTDRDCFAQADRTTLQWLGRRRIGLLLAAPPLRPLPASPPAEITLPALVSEINFADRAGVALLMERSQQYDVIDIGSSEVIFRGERGGSPALSLSPNGQLYVVEKGADTEVRESATGALLATFPDVHSHEFFWVHDVGAIYQATSLDAASNQRRTGPVFLDFSSGRESPIPMAMPMVSRVIALPGAEPRFALLSWSSIGEIKLVQETAGWVAQLQFEHRLETPINSARNSSGLTANGDTFFGTAERLQVLPLATLEPRYDDLSPLRLQGALATADPDKLLVYGFFADAPGLAQDIYLYSLSQRTLALVDKSQLKSPWLIYIPSLHSNAIIDKTRIVPIASLPVSAAAPVAGFLAQREQQLGATKIAVVRDAPSPSPLALSGNAPSPTVHPGSVAELAKIARIEAIGVYQGSGVGQARGASARTGTVQVRVMRAKQPLILSLSAYEPVRWVVTVEPGVKVAAVLLSGYSDSEVFGAGDAKIYRIGRDFAYRRGQQYEDLDSAVKSWTGKGIDGFHGSYTGNIFVVGL